MVDLPAVGHIYYICCLFGLAGGRHLLYFLIKLQQKAATLMGLRSLLK